MNSDEYRRRGIIRICPVEKGGCGTELDPRTDKNYSCGNLDCTVFSVHFSQKKPLGTHISKIIYASVPRVVIT